MSSSDGAPVVLNAMTLHGIGPYIGGARLEIKPLTVLCGKNGSGKSTWFKALNMLKRTAEAKSDIRLPYGFEVTDHDPKDLRSTNAFYHLANPNAHQARAEAHPTHEVDFGPPGTIGLELEVKRDLFLPTFSNSEETAATHAWLNGGICKAGTRVRIRLAHPTYVHDDIATPLLRHFIEIEFDGKYAIRMEGERDPFQQFDSRHLAPRRSKPYLLSCSAILLGTDAHLIHDIRDIAILRNLRDWRYDEIEEDAPSGLVEQLVSCIDCWVPKLAGEALNGYFFLGAIRRPFIGATTEELPGTTEQKSVAEARHVGTEGEFAWLLERAFGSSEFGSNREGLFTADDIDLLALRGLLNDPESASPLDAVMKRIVERSPNDAREQCKTLLNPSDESIKRLYLRGDDLRGAKKAIAELLNSVLDDEGLFDFRTWFDEYSFPSWNEYDASEDPSDPSIPQTYEEYVLNEIEVGWNFDWLLTWLRPYVAGERFTGETLRRFNADMIVISGVFDWDRVSVFNSSQYPFPIFVSNWIERLSGKELWLKSVEVIRHHNRQSDFNRRVQREPRCDFLNAYSPTSAAEPTRLTQLGDPCFGRVRSRALECYSQIPRQQSAGFHQIFPIVVQLALMRRGEVFCVENPEAHLHPQMQVRVAEMLLMHAQSGRRVIVETHGDLVIRRLMRAILAEEVSQAGLQICFADLADSVVDEGESVGVEYAGATLEALRVDDRGRIANWPEGFLDEDATESQRALDVMYGGRRSDTESDERDGEADAE